MAKEPSARKLPNTNAGSTPAVKGHLDLLLLAVLADGARHGYGVIDELRSRSGEAFDLPEGTVYPALHRLERSGLITSDWDDSAGRPRRIYRLNPAGRASLREKRAAWTEFATTVSTILEGTPWPTSPRTITA